MSTHYVLKIQYVNKPPETRNINARVTTIGREAGDIVLGDPQSSGRHAEIYFENGNVRVKDLGSTNGTFYNGQRTPEFTLQAGHGFSIGQTVLTLMAIHGAQQRAGAGKTMIAMGGMPPRPPGAPPGAPPAPAGFGAPPPSSSPGAPPGAPAGFGAPPPSSAPPAAGFGAPPQPPAGAGFGAPPPGSAPAQGGFGAPPPGPAPSSAPAQAGFGAPPSGSPPAGAGFGAPPSGSPPSGGFGAPPPGSPPPSSPTGAPPQGGFGSPPPGSPPGGPPPGAPPSGGFGAPAPTPSGQMVGNAFAAAGAAMNPNPNPSPQPFGAGPMATAPGGEIRGDFSGTGGELLGQLFVGYLLTVITFGIYAPWFMCKYANFIAERVTFGPTAKGTVRFRFQGQGGELFVTFLVGYLLTVITFGIYMPWFMCKLTKFYADNSVATTDDGSTYQPSFNGSGGDLFVTFLVGYLLTAVTFGIYFPWFLCNINKWFASNTKITKNGQQVGDIDFVGQGGELLVTFIVGYLLTVITFGIYGAWFQVKLLQFNADSTKLTVEGKRMGMRFTGQGGELFVIVLVGYLLAIVTFGIYMFWLMAKLLKWQLSNTVVFSEGAAPMAMGAPMGGPAFGGAPPQGQMFGQPPQGQLGAPGYGAPQGGFGGPPQGGGYA